MCAHFRHLGAGRQYIARWHEFGRWRLVGPLQILTHRRDLVGGILTNQIEMEIEMGHIVDARWHMPVRIPVNRITSYNVCYTKLLRKLLITGTNGTLAPVVAHLFNQQGWDCVAWDRQRVNPDDADACHAFWQATKPDAVCHLALGGEAWATWLAEQSARAAIPYLFTSSAMVFDNAINGPYDIASQKGVHIYAVKGNWQPDGTSYNFV